MSIRIARSRSKEGKTEFILVGLDTFEDFDIIINHLIQSFGVTVVEQLDGIYSRIATLHHNGSTLKLIYHEDIGNYFFNVHSTDEADEKLFSLLEDLSKLL